MKKVTTIFTAAVLVAAGIAYGEARDGQIGGHGDRAWHNYNRAAVETVSGRVESVGTYDRGGVHVTVKDSKGTIDVHLGPDFYVKERIPISTGDVITVVGSRVKYNGRDVIIARSVEKDGRIVTLRHDDGTPMWSGQGHRRSQCHNC